MEQIVSEEIIEFLKIVKKC